MNQGVSEDHFLIEGAIAGSEEACARLVRRHQTMVARVALRVTHRPELVDDVVQEVFLTVFRKLAKFERRSGFKTWLYRIAVNTSIEALRKEDARKRLNQRAEVEGDALPDAILVQRPQTGERLALNKEMQQRIHAALGSLPTQARMVLTLRYLEELSTVEIAKALELPEGTVRSRLHYARIKLAEALGPYMEKAETGKRKKR